jgi:DNA-directed RNA polymerase specialized sigma24 family protein
VAEACRLPGGPQGLDKVLQELQQRSRKHHDNRFLDDWNGSHPTRAAEDVGSAVADSDAARRIYRELTPSEQLLFDIAFLRDLSVEDAATAMGISRTAFTSRVNRLRGRLLTLNDLEHSQPKPTTSGGAL